MLIYEQILILNFKFYFFHTCGVLGFWGMTQSKGDGAFSCEGDSAGNASEMSCLPAVPSSLFMAANLKKVQSERINELQEIFA